jgi:hypothetical protein
MFVNWDAILYLFCMYAACTTPQVYGQAVDKLQVLTTIIATVAMRLHVASSGLWQSSTTCSIKCEYKAFAYNC